MANSLADQMRLKMIALGATTGSLADLERQYYVTVSGQPAGTSIDGHRRAFYITAATTDSKQSVNDLEQRYWAFINAGNIIGSNADRGKLFYV